MTFFDDEGVQQLVCLKLFCGIEGYGPYCSEIGSTWGVDNCRRVYGFVGTKNE